MTKKELQVLQDSILKEFQTHRSAGGFDVHAISIARVYEILYLVVEHLNKKPTRKK